MRLRAFMYCINIQKELSMKVSTPNQRMHLVLDLDEPVEKTFTLKSNARFICLQIVQWKKGKNMKRGEFVRDNNSVVHARETYGSGRHARGKYGSERRTSGSGRRAVPLQ